MPTTGRSAPGKTHVQSVIFAKKKWTPEKARAWLKEHDFTSGNMEETGTSYRFRQYDPQSEKFRYRTTPAGDATGINLVTGFVAKSSGNPLAFEDHSEHW